MTNPYKEELNIFFTRVVELQNILFHLKNIFKKDLERKGKLVQKNRSKNDIAMVSHLVISDISSKNDEGNLVFPTGYTKKVAWNKYEEELKKTISREACFLISQAYEAFTRFIKNNSAIFLFLNRKIATDIDKLFEDCKTINDFKTRIRKSESTKYPTQLFQILEDNCVEYRRINNGNILNNKLSDYYESLAFFRHKVVHSSSTFTKKELNDNILSRGLKEVFKYHFPYKKTEEENFKFTMDKHKGQFIISKTAEVGFQIYKGLSKCAGLDWKLEKQKKK